MATTAVENSVTPSWRIASSLVESASTTWVSTPERSWTILASESTPSTSWPMPTSVAASPPPKRPRPMTTNSLVALANDRTLLGEAVQLAPLAQDESDAECMRPDAPEVHERDQDPLAEAAEVGSHAR